MLAEAGEKNSGRSIPWHVERLKQNETYRSKKGAMGEEGSLPKAEKKHVETKIRLVPSHSRKRHVGGRNS